MPGNEFISSRLLRVRAEELRAELADRLRIRQAQEGDAGPPRGVTGRRRQRGVQRSTPSPLADRSIPERGLPE